MRALFQVVPIVALTALPGCGDARRDIVAPRLDVAESESGPSANGHGNWINSIGEYISRSFHAREVEPGVVTGSWEYHFTSPTGEKRMNKGYVDCLRIIAPNEAVISGRVEVSMNPALVGQVQIFRVVDNGEGDDQPADRLSALSARSPDLGIDCSNFTPANTTPIVSGNLQVRP